MKNIRVFYLKIFSFLEVNFSIYLNRRVFVMDCEVDGPPSQNSTLDANVAENDGRADGKIMLLSPILTMWGSHIANPNGRTDRQTVTF